MYGEFAKVYDSFMAEVEYEKWVDYIISIFNKYGKTPKLIAELGCGTGNITTIMAKKGYDMIGIDISGEMLQIAKEKNNDILYLSQDIRKFELYGTVDCIVCLCDTLNYILLEDEILEVFKHVNNYLEPDGLFIFDVNTMHKFKNVLGDGIFAENQEQASVIWENYYYEEEKINEYELTIFMKNKDSDMFSKAKETHLEKAYSTSELKKLIKKSGLVFLDVYGECTFDKPKRNSERNYFVAKKSR